MLIHEDHVKKHAVNAQQQLGQIPTDPGAVPGGVDDQLRNARDAAREVEQDLPYRPALCRLPTVVENHLRRVLDEGQGQLQGRECVDLEFADEFSFRPHGRANACKETERTYHINPLPMPTNINPSQARQNKSNHYRDARDSSRTKTGEPRPPNLVPSLGLLDGEPPELAQHDRDDQQGVQRKRKVPLADRGPRIVGVPSGILRFDDGREAEARGVRRVADEADEIGKGSVDCGPGYGASTEILNGLWVE